MRRREQTMKRSDNLYWLARMDAAARNPIFSSRDRAAEAVFCSPDSLGDYETGKTLPPCAVVQRMIEAYGTPWLRARHVRECCPILTSCYCQEDENARTLQQSAMGWLLAFRDMEATAWGFAGLLRDGSISADEREALAGVRARAVEIRALMQQTIDAMDGTAGREAARP